MTETRTCTTCMKAFLLSPEFFYKDASKSGGFTSECKSCKKARSRENSKKRYALAKAVREATKRRSPAEAFVAFGEAAAKPKPQNRGGRRVNYMARLGKAIAQEAKRLQHEQELVAQPLKTCLVCQEEKPLGLFNKDPRTADGRSNVCKACKSEQRRAKVEGREGPKAIKPLRKPEPPSSAPKKSGRGPRTRKPDAPLVALAKAIEVHAREELEAQRFNAMVERESAKNQAHCKAYVDWLVRNDGRPVRWGEVRVNPMVFAVAREGGSMWGWPEVTEEDREMAERYGRLPCIRNMSLTEALQYPEWLHLFGDWNPTNFLNYSAWAGLKRWADHATLGADAGAFPVFDVSELDVDAEWDAMLGEV